MTKRKRIVLYFCPKKCGCGKLQSCIKIVGSQPGCQCKDGRCDSFADCEDRTRFATIDKFKSHAKVYPDTRALYRAEFVLCNDCRT